MPSQFSRKVSLSRIREVNHLDYDLICCQLEAARARVEGTDITKLSNVHYTTKAIVDGVVDSKVLDDAFLVCYGVGSPWYSTRVFLEERMVLRLRRGSSFSAVCDLLDDLADEHGANDIIVGGALARYPRALTRMYKARGYVLLDIPSLIKRR